MSELKKLSEPFEESQIEWRLAQAGKNANGFWGKCLAYIQARAVMDRFDAVCGPENWKARYEFHAGGVLCGLSVRVNNEWVEKFDGADATDVEPFKGGISSALKRAAVLWGVGRYLYDLEEGWAVIVPHGTKGAHYGQTKDKETFYWNPPKLPAWALPKKTEVKVENVQTIDKVEAERVMIAGKDNGWNSQNVLAILERKWGLKGLGQVRKTDLDSLLDLVTKRRPEIVMVELGMNTGNDARLFETP